MRSVKNRQSQYLLQDIEESRNFNGPNLDTYDQLLELYNNRDKYPNLGIQELGALCKTLRKTINETYDSINETLQPLLRQEYVSLEKLEEELLEEYPEEFI